MLNQSTRRALATRDIVRLHTPRRHPADVRSHTDPAAVSLLQPTQEALRHLSAVLHGIYGITAAHSAADFRNAALDWLAQHLPFDSACWGLGNPRGGRTAVIQTHLRGLPPDFIREWARVAEQDVIAQDLCACVGSAIMLSGDHRSGDEVRRFDRRHKLTSALAILMPPGGDGLSHFMALFRGPASPAFGLDEHQLFELVAPHMARAESLALRQRASDAELVTGELVAAVAADGHLKNPPTALCRALVSEFPLWTGGQLPKAMWPARSETWRGKAWEARLTPQDRSIRSDPTCWVIRLCPRMGMGLTGREQEIARAFATGSSYKQVARQLDLSPATVRGYLRESYRKLGISSKAQLAQAIRRHESQAVQARDTA